jgi:hypothetical protein
MISLGIQLIGGRDRANLIARKRCNSPKDVPAMTTRRTADNSKALDAFLTVKAEIDVMLERLQALSDDHFKTDPDEIHWGHVGTLKNYAGLLRQITDSAFKEGEHAA